MKYRIKLSAIIVALFVAFLVVRAQASESQYEFYSNADQETLNNETREMGVQLREMFNQQDVASKQRNIDFAEYFSNMRKLVFYSNKLSTYSDYEQNLTFARDKEIFKGLPEEVEQRNNATVSFDRKEFTDTKYDRMKRNVQEEVATYQDLILLSLDSCQSIIANDLTGIMVYEGYQTRVKRFMKSKEYALYDERKDMMIQTWPELVTQIDTQFSYWQAKQPALDDPIIDPSITGAL
jgi:hypothetical protein